MKYSNEIIINLPRKRVVELFEDPNVIKEWQPSLEKMEPISGPPGQTGSKTKFIYKERGRTMEMVETIVRRNLPDEFNATYEMGGVYNLQVNHFYDEGNKTRWVSESEFKFSGVMVLMGLFMRGAFPKQTQKFMQMFKDFAESQ